MYSIISIYLENAHLWFTCFEKYYRNVQINLQSTLIKQQMLIDLATSEPTRSTGVVNANFYSNHSKFLQEFSGRFENLLRNLGINSFCVYASGIAPDHKMRFTSYFTSSLLGSLSFLLVDMFEFESQVTKPQLQI